MFYQPLDHVVFLLTIFLLELIYGHPVSSVSLNISFLFRYLQRVSSHGDLLVADTLIAVDLTINEYSIFLFITSRILFLFFDDLGMNLEVYSPDLVEQGELRVLPIKFGLITHKQLGFDYDT